MREPASVGTDSEVFFSKHFVRDGQLSRLLETPSIGIMYRMGGVVHQGDFLVTEDCFEELCKKHDIKVHWTKSKRIII